jgi:hypothetical protein
MSALPWHHGQQWAQSSFSPMTAAWPSDFYVTITAVQSWMAITGIAAMQVLNLLNSRPMIQAGRKPAPFQNLLNLSQHDAVCRNARAIKTPHPYILFNRPLWSEIGESK